MSISFDNMAQREALEFREESVYKILIRHSIAK